MSPSASAVADFSVDESGFNAAMNRQKEQARAAGKFKMDKALDYQGAGNTFVGYEQLQMNAHVLALYVDGTPVHALKAGQSGVVVLDTTNTAKAFADLSVGGGEVTFASVDSAGNPSTDICSVDSST